MKQTIRLCVAVVAFTVFASSRAAAAPIVSFTASGSANNWLLNFSVTNTLAPSTNQVLYFFGVELPPGSLAGSPTKWGQWSNGLQFQWTNAPYGGSSRVYHTNWFATSAIVTGQTLGGFQAHVTTLLAPTSINWFVWAQGPRTQTYTGTDAFYTNTFNPGFEGVALNATTVPEPASFAVLAIGVVGCGLLRRRCRRSA